MDYGLEGQVRFLTRIRDFSLLHSIETTSGVHAGPFSMGTGATFRGIEMAGMNLITHLHLVSRSIMAEQYLHSPILLCVVGLS
jgi:hypothetical protein